MPAATPLVIGGSILAIGVGGAAVYYLFKKTGISSDIGQTAAQAQLAESGGQALENLAANQAFGGGLGSGIGQAATTALGNITAGFNPQSWQTSPFVVQADGTVVTAPAEQIVDYSKQLVTDAQMRQKLWPASLPKYIKTASGSYWVRTKSVRPAKLNYAGPFSSRIAAGFFVFRTPGY